MSQPTFSSPVLGRNPKQYRSARQARAIFKRTPWLCWRTDVIRALPE